MEWLWTHSGRSFGYRGGNQLWTYDGRHVGCFLGKEVYGPDGRYVGELAGHRLATNPQKKGRRWFPFSPEAGTAGLQREKDHEPYAPYAGFVDFPAPEALG